MAADSGGLDEQGGAAAGVPGWKITADTTQIASGTLAASDTTPEGRKLAASLPAQADTVTITAQRTDDEACETILQWESAGVA